jgi:hypothetical protein
VATSSGLMARAAQVHVKTSRRIVAAAGPPPIADLWPGDRRFRVGPLPDSCTAQQAPVLKSVADCFCKFSMPSTVNAARKRYL